jgi:hypothetical protein
VSIDWHEHTAKEDVICQLCWGTIRKGWTCCENTNDFDGPDWFHPECLEVTESWTEEQWDDYWVHGIDLSAIAWPKYDEHGNVIAQADPACVSCGRPRSQGCDDPTACGISALPFSQQCDATRDSNDYVCVQDVRHLIPSERWPELERLYMLEVHDCGWCGGDGKNSGTSRACIQCGGTGKQIIAGGVG